MSDLQQFAKILQSWKDQDKKLIFDILKRVDGTNFQKQDRFEAINKAVVDFHKEIQNTDRDLIDSEWFAYVLKIKKKLKQVSENMKRRVDKNLVLVKKASAAIQYPNDLFQDVRQSERDVVKILFKNFVSNLPEEFMKNPKTTNFIKQVNRQLRKMFQDQLEEKKNKRVDSICMHLSRQGAIGAKLQMIQGKKNSRQIAEDEQSSYRDELAQRKIQEHMKQQFQMSQTGFYDQMKKQIFKEASQQCRFCHKLSAYCNDMKQIRASDQPMTRFMKCNTCQKDWRD